MEWAALTNSLPLHQKCDTYKVKDSPKGYVWNTINKYTFGYTWVAVMARVVDSVVQLTSCELPGSSKT